MKAFALSTRLLVFSAILTIAAACNDVTDQKTRQGSWVNGHVTRNGRYIKGHFRNSVSFDPNKVKNNIRSRSYYQRNKYRYHKSRR